MSTTTHDSELKDLIAKATELARAGKGTGGPPHDEVGALLAAYYRHVAPEDVSGRADVDVYGALASHYRLAAERPQGTARVRVLTPTLAEDGWSAGGHSVVEVVTDDMPFLVDSLTMELSRELRDVHVVVHPHFDVRRDITGALLHVAPVDDGALEPDDDSVRESWMHVEIDRIADGDAAAIVDDVQRVLRDVREAVEDWPRTRQRMLDVVGELRAQVPSGLDPEEVRQGAELLEWLTDDHFTFLGFREYALEQHDGEDVLRAVPGTGLGILRADQDTSEAFARLPEPVKAKAREKTLLVLAKANSRATVHRPAYLDYVGVKTFDATGEVTGERRFLGLFSSSAYAESLIRIPLLREKAREVLRRSGFDPRSYAGRALMDTLEGYPRDELFHTTVDELAPMAEAAMHARERRAVRAITRADTYGRYVSVLVYLPRDRYNTAVREKFSEILLDQLGGESVEFTVRINESTTARVHFVVHLPRQVGDPTVTGTLRALDTTDLERRLADASRSWRDDFLAAVLSEYGEQVGATLGRRYVDSFPEAYKEDFLPRAAAVDVGCLEGIEGEEGLDLSLAQHLDAGRGEARLKVFRVGSPLSLSAVLPMLSSLGVEVVDERPYELDDLDRPTYVYEFGLRYGTALPDDARELFVDALRAVWDGRAEVDGFNRLVLGVGLGWRQAMLLRAYAKYMRQGASPFAVDTIEEALAANVDITRMLVRLFELRFDPAVTDREQQTETLEARLGAALDDVASLDHDRILRGYLTLIRATLRTNHFQRAADGSPKDYLSLKLEPSAIPDLPSPRPKFEIFVYSPRVEGVHLRFGSVARGGLRWSDRRDDFRTEVLGLVKAQMVKNTVIVPVGAKGGFYAKNLPDPGDREAWMAEGIACYRTFISGLLDITDNLVEGSTVPPADVVRHDGDDAYLVVAADKGTATFSDIANEVAMSYGFWLGDAFASGGSVGYDHKAMGITARGAWVSVQRHFRERGIDCQAEDFTCVGIGDMSGDVFGNGMLCSEHTRLVAAFDHRDIFLDPDPDAATSYAERKRLFELPRSSWQDYDTALISEGGGVWSRSRKSIPLNDHVRRALGIDAGVEQMTPNELMRAILTAPVDLLWNGGIGTYVKASSESHADAGDRANNGLRVNGNELRCRAVGEGGNLGLTQRGRIEAAMNGVLVNTDFIDNSAGVDTSDHEVNIKILLAGPVQREELSLPQRNELLASMTDEVAELVLNDNYRQNQAISLMERMSAARLGSFGHFIRVLEGQGLLDRAIEFLPSEAELGDRKARGQGLTRPELSVLLSYDKIVVFNQMLDSDVPEDPYLSKELVRYFPNALQERFAQDMENHRLRREIIATAVTNSTVNRMGATFLLRMQEDTGQSAAQIAKAFTISREVLDARELWAGIDALDLKVSETAQLEALTSIWQLQRNLTRWLLNRPGEVLNIAEKVERYAGGVAELRASLDRVLPEAARAELAADVARWQGHGYPEDMARAFASLPFLAYALDIVEVAIERSLPVAEVAASYFSLSDALHTKWLMDAVEALPVGGRWHAQARGVLRDELQAQQRALVGQVLVAGAGLPAEQRVERWLERDDAALRYTMAMFADMRDLRDLDYPTLSVAVRRLAQVVASGAA